jgi:DNA-binding YbaB/EbfC family protein
MTDEPVLDQSGGMPDLMAAVMDMQAGMQAAQAELAAALLTGSAGGGLVTAQIRGTGELVSVTISPDAVDPDDIEMLEDLVVAAVNDAMRQSAELTTATMSQASGGFDLGAILGGSA